jgi:acetylornithine deacetylase/succinyl-diaminopimelate desuccinylase-like protein
MIRIEGSEEKKSLIFSIHMDTVPPGEIAWTFDPFGGVEWDSWIQECGRLQNREHRGV